MTHKAPMESSLPAIFLQRGHGVTSSLLFLPAHLKPAGGREGINYTLRDSQLRQQTQRAEHKQTAADE